MCDRYTNLTKHLNTNPDPAPTRDRHALVSNVTSETTMETTPPHPNPGRTRRNKPPHTTHPIKRGGGDGDSNGAQVREQRGSSSPPLAARPKKEPEFDDRRPLT